MKKEVKRFSLKKRLIALFMALAMVLGVVYIGNRTERHVDADDAIPDGDAYTDESFIFELISPSGAGSYADQMLAEYTDSVRVIVPTKNMKLALPAAFTDDAAAAETVYISDEGVAYAEADEGLKETKVRSISTYIFLKKGSVDPADRAFYLGLAEDSTAGTYKEADLVYIKSYSLADDQEGLEDPYTGTLSTTEGLTAAAAEVKASVTVQGKAITPVETTVNNSERTVTLANEGYGTVDALEGYTDQLYGAFQYDLYEGDTAVIKNAADLGTLSEELNKKDIDHDKTYYIVKNLTSDAYTAAYGTKENDSFTRNFYLGIKNVKTQVGWEQEKEQADYSDIQLNAMVSQKVQLSFGIDEEFDSVIVEKGTLNGDVTVTSGSNTWYYSAEITPQPADNNTLATIKFSVKGKGTDAATDEIVLKIQFGDSTPEASIIKVMDPAGDEELVMHAEDHVYYTTNPLTKIEAEAKSNDTISSVVPVVKIGETEAEGDALTGTGAENRYAGTVSLAANADAVSQIYVKASAGGITGTSDAVSVVYDSKTPTFGEAVLTGKVKGSGNTVQTIGAAEEKFADAISVKNGDSYTLEVTPADANLDSVKATRAVKGEADADYGTETAVTVSDNKITESSNEEFVGKTVRYTVTAADKAGRIATKIYYVTIANDYVKITHTVQFGGQVRTSNDGADKQYGPYGKDVLGSDENIILTYKVLSSEEIGSAVFADEGTELEVTADVKAAAEKEDGNFVYTYEVLVPLTFSQEYKNPAFTFVNENGTSVTEKAEYIQIDITDPNVTLENIPAEWVNAYKIFIKAKADADADTNFSYDDDPDADQGDTWGSGVKSVFVKQTTSKEAGSFKEYNIPEDGIIEIDVKESTDISGTVVTIYAKDQAGNTSKEVSGTFYVDAGGSTTRPGDIYIGGYGLGSLGDGKKAFGPDEGSDLTVSMNVKDNIGVKVVKVHVKREYDGSSASGTAYYYRAMGTDEVVCASSYPDGLVGINFDTSKTGTRYFSELVSVALGDGTDISAAMKAGDYDGTYEVTFTVLDNAENENNPVLRSAKFDLINKAPVTTLELQKTAKLEENGIQYFDGSVPVKIVVKDKMGVQSVAVKDSNADELKTAIGTWSNKDNSKTTDERTKSISNEGRHDLSATGNGRSNIQSNTASASVVIDTIKPSVTLSYGGTKLTKDQVFSSKNAITLGIEEANLLSAEWTVTVKPSDGTAQTSETMTKAGSFTCNKDAEYTVSYTVVDKALHKVTGTESFIVDTVAPWNDITFFKEKTPDPAKFSTYYNGYVNNATGTAYRYGQYYNTSVALNFTVTDYNVNTKDISVVDSYSGSAVGLTWGQPNEKGVRTASATISGDGDHRITMTTKDAAGNSSAGVSVAFTIDTKAPTLFVSLNGSSYSGIRYLNTNGIVGVSIGDEHKDSADITQKVVRTRPSQSDENLVSTVSEGSQTFDVEADYTVTYTTRDLAGNESAPVTISFRVDKTAPQLTISGIADKGTSTQDVNVTYGMREDFYWDMEDAEISIYKKVDGGNSQLIRTDKFNARNANASMSQLFTEDGEYSFSFRAADKAGNTAETNYSFILDGNAPVITLSGVSNYDKTVENVEFAAQIDETFYASNKVEIKGTRQDKYGEITEVDFGTLAVNSTNPAVIDKEFAQDGIYDITVKATDKAGNTSEEKIHFTIDTEDPEISGLEAYDGTVINKFNGVPDVDDLIVDLTVCKYKFYLDGVEYDGTGEISQGSHVFRIEATDELGHTLSEGNEFSFKFDSVAPTILVDGIEDGEKVEASREIQVSLQLNEDTLTSVKLNGKDMPIDGNTSTFTVDSKGKYELVITAVDDAGNQVSQTLHFEYAKKMGWLWLLLLIIGIVLIAGAGFFIIAARRRKQDEER